MSKTKIPEKYDLICVGGGIMSATLSLMLKLLDPKIKILIFERLDKVAQESSAAWNNSGTGHSAFCELNYTPEGEKGTISISKAIKIFKQFEQSKQLWSYLVKQNLIENPRDFIHTVPHHSWVLGKENVDFLKKRYEAMQTSVAFESMKYSEGREALKSWFPLIMNDRLEEEPMAATRMEMGTEVNFGALTKKFFQILENQFNTPVHTAHEVEDIDPGKSTEWFAEVKNLKTGEKSYYDANHVFIGAGGGALPLLQKVEIPEKKGYGGFPVSGQWLVCNNREVIDKHHAKVYSKAGLNAPPMSTPHLDTRYINGKKELMFGPFAGFSTKFLKKGSFTDLFKSIKFSNIPSMWGVFWHNLPLTKYLIEQVRMDHADRMEELQKFVKDAKPEDWELKVAGQRVQIIKRDEEEGGILEFGTDVVHSKDGSITVLLGASPGASVAVNIMLEVIEEIYPQKFQGEEWKTKLSEMIPFWNKEIDENIELFKEVQSDSSKLLELEVLH
ncbi:MAG TPA: malate dehydrogenase (quinone) [Flavobacteriaceae bacterium]|nr:malate dehydrogenase (quinone) [Flavobacteriaceae bacterium]